jgi:hypothetical protein
MFWAAVPKTSVHKNHDSFTAKSKIGLARKRSMPAPAYNPDGPENGCHFEFRILIATASYGRHYARAFLF